MWTHNIRGSQPEILPFINLDSDTQVTLTRQSRSDEVSSPVGLRPCSPLSPPSLSGSITLHHQLELRAPGHPSQPALTSGGQVSQTARVRRVRRGSVGAGTSDPDPTNANSPADLESVPAF